MPGDGQDGGRVHLRTLILIRWVAIVGQLLTVLIVQYGLELVMPVGAVLAVIGVSVLLNTAATIQRRTRVHLGDRDAALYLAYDLLQLAVVLFLTGGLTNPFAVLLLVPLTVSATILSRRIVFALTMLTLACTTVLAVWHAPLPAGPDGPMVLPWLYNVGVWFALSLAAGFIATYVWRVAREARRFAGAYTASQMALERERRVSALGALAAAAAHELGTPLGTISVVAKELTHSVCPDDPLAEDVALLASQAERCRDILAALTRQPETQGGDPYERLSPAALIEAAAHPHRRLGITLDVVLPPAGADAPPVAARRPEMIQGLGNLLQNAMQFARSRVLVRFVWDADEVELTITDDGPGFPPGVLSRLGEPYLSRRDGPPSLARDHMGLGIFIATMLLERCGGRIRFSNRRKLGAKVVVSWKRLMFESEQGGAASRRGIGAELVEAAEE